jgi:hypothetical protein
MKSYPPNFLSFPLVAEKIKQGSLYKKKEKTDLRLPLSEEIGTVLDTYVFDVKSGKLRVEISTPITSDSVIARNQGVIGHSASGPVFNEWVVPRKDIEQKYEAGILEKLTTSFSSHQKKQTVRAIQLTQALLDELKIKGDTLMFSVSWADTFMTAKVGDFLTDGGYSISQHDMAKTYEPVNEQAEKVIERKPKFHA